MHHRCEHRVRAAERAEQERSFLAITAGAIGPDFLNARHIGTCVIRQIDRADRTVKIHAAFIAQRHEARMHLRRNRARMRAPRAVLRPQLRLREFLGEIFDDRKRIPHRDIAIDQRRHLARAGKAENPVLVRLDDNTIFSVNKEKMVKEYVGSFGEASGDIKVKSGTMKLKAFTPIERSQIPEGPATKLLDVRTYQAKGSAQLHEKVRHELAMIAYITTFDFISFTLVGNDVILTGWTVRDTNRSDAEYRVKKIEGVGKVTNNIEILPLGGIDMEIRAAARSALQRTHSTYFWSNGSDIKIVVKNGTIILLGAVRTQQDFDSATIQLNSLSGVFHVFNMLRVTPPAPKDKG